MNGAHAPIKFGTDGWRAIIAREFTFANLERVAQAYADYLTSCEESSLLKQLVSKDEAEDPLFANGVRKWVTSTSRLVIVGYDRRFLSEHFAQRAAEVIVANGFSIALFQEAVPTPLVSWAVKDLGASGGVVITASHNPPEFNGFKIKAPWGGSAAPETTSAVEKLLDLNPPKLCEIKTDGHELLEPTIKSYREHISSYVDLEVIRGTSGLVVIDPMHGSGSHWVESFLGGG